MDLVNQQLSGPRLSQMSRQLGISEDQTREALPAALAALTGGLAQNAAQPQGAQQLANALNKDHDGGLLDSLDGFLGGMGGMGAGGGNLGAGAAILGHVFGQRKQQVEGNLGRATGLNPQTMASLLAMLAPIVMAYLGRQQRQKQLDPGGLAEVLGQERQRIEQVPQARTGLGALLDLDGDGQVMDDLANLAGGLFGKRQ
ncbi:MAG TPA: DUF937 domain-containing protein [Thermoanaerobaculia bacterium]|nr:DUF937 domain-containing protein [Thermoanaerobaculia bacterium]